MLNGLIQSFLGGKDIMRQIGRRSWIPRDDVWNPWAATFQPAIQRAQVPDAFELMQAMNWNSTLYSTLKIIDDIEMPTNWIPLLSGAMGQAIRKNNWVDVLAMLFPTHNQIRRP